MRKGVFSRVSGQVHAVDDVSFAIAEGETLGLVGESGCGKSTTGKAILRLIDPTAGSIAWRGRRIDTLVRGEMRPYRRELQVVFQDPYSSLNPRMRARRHRRRAAPQLRGRRRPPRSRERVAALFDKVACAPTRWSSTRTSSPAASASASASRARSRRNPRLIVCDEPVSALDVSVQAQVINLLMDLQDEFGLSYLFIAHDLAVVEHISHRVAVMYLGKIVELADKRALFTNPQHPYTEALLSAVPVPDPQAARKRIILAGDVPSPIQPPAGCRFHTRCPYAMERCRVEEPLMKEVRRAFRRLPPALTRISLSRTS